MCGIAGLVGSVRGASVEELLTKIAHRGPDGAGSLNEGPLQLAMNRLRFRGEKVKLPLISDGRLAAFNGQIYGVKEGTFGYREVPGGLDMELDSVLNHRSCTDGMYAFAIASPSGEEVHLGTDRFSIKPLFVRQLKNGVAFCSEIGPLLEISTPASINADALCELFSFGWYLGAETFATELLVACRHDIHIVNQKVLLCEKQKPTSISKVTPSDIRQALSESVRRCLQGSGPFGLAVSGGLDSTILAWELNAAGIENVVTLSVRQHGEDDGIEHLNELDLPPGGAWETWRHRVVRIDQTTFLSDFQRSIRSFGQPSTMSSLPLYQRLAEAAADEGVRVLITGEGADELFAGYSSYKKVGSLPSPLDYYRHAPRIRLVRALFGDRVSHAQEKFSNLYCDINDIRDIETEMRLSRLLLRTDTCLMSRSVEGRVPFLHNGIPEMAMGTPCGIRAAGLFDSALISEPNFDADVSCLLLSMLCLLEDRSIHAY